MLASLPHSRCNWIIENSVLIGASPQSHTLPLILETGITVFVNLVEKRAAHWYQKRLPRYVIYLSFPIASRNEPDKIDTDKLLDYLLFLISEGKKLYVHCRGGNGRAGMIAALLYGRYYNVHASEAIRAIEKAREQRIDKSRNFVPTPETTAQVEFVGQMLGVLDDDPLPDRSDLSWLQKL